MMLIDESWCNTHIHTHTLKEPYLSEFLWISFLCSTEEVIQNGMTFEWINDGSIFILGWTMTVRLLICSKPYYSPDVWLCPWQPPQQPASQNLQWNPIGEPDVCTSASQCLLLLSVRFIVQMVRVKNQVFQRPSWIIQTQKACHSRVKRYNLITWVVRDKRKAKQSKTKNKILIIS